MCGLNNSQGSTSSQSSRSPILVTPQAREQRDEFNKAVHIGSQLYDVTGQSLPRADRLRTVRNHTKIAKNYGHPRGYYDGRANEIVKYTGKSGLTPIRPSGDMIADPVVRGRIWAVEEHQRSNIYGFTAEELCKLGALAVADDRSMAADLQSALHPAFIRQRWQTENSMPKHVGAIPVLGDDDGFWLAENQRIWDILEPCLLLASRLLVAPYEDTWLDTLFRGKRIPIVNHPGLTRVMGRTRQEILNDAAAVRDNLDRVARFVRMGLRSGNTDVDALPCVSDQVTLSSGVTNYGTCDAGQRITVEIWVSVELLQPLLRDDLTSAEIMTQRLQVASTILHEYAHAAHRVLKILSLEPLSQVEPYFEDEPLIELGYSFETHIFGGTTLSVIEHQRYRGGPGLPTGGIIKSSFFTAMSKDYGGSQQQMLPRPVAQNAIDPFYVVDYWPICTDWSADLSKEDFWNARVKQFGNQVLKMGPQTFGIRAHVDKNLFLLYSSKHDVLLQHVNGATAELDLFGEPRRLDIRMDPTQSSTVIAENLRRMKTRTILNSINYPNIASHSFGNESANEEYRNFDPLADPETRPKLVEEYPPNLPYPCPRYHEIKKWLINNRDPLHLAIDSMGILAEPAFYRYIRERSKYLRDRGINSGLMLTPHEFRGFLFTAQKKKELFVWEPLPIPGVVFKVSKGWPPRSKPYSIPPPARIPRQDAVDRLEYVLASQQTQASLYRFLGEVRDYDIFEFQMFLNADEDNRQFFNIRLGEFCDILLVHVAGSFPMFTFGPRNILRFTYPIEQFRNLHANNDQKELVARLQRKEMGYNLSGPLPSHPLSNPNPATHAPNSPSPVTPATFRPSVGSATSGPPPRFGLVSPLDTPQSGTIGTMQQPRGTGQGPLGGQNSGNGAGRDQNSSPRGRGIQRGRGRAQGRGRSQVWR